MVAGLSGVIFSAKFRTRKQRRMAQAKCRVICRCDKRKAQPSVQLLVAGNQNQRDPTHTGNTTKESAWQHAANRHCERVFISKARDAPNKSKKKGCRERSKGKTKTTSVAKKNNTIRLGHKWMEVVTNTLARMENHKGQDSLESQRIKWSPSGSGMKLNVIVRTQEEKSWQGDGCESSTQRTEGRETPLYQLTTSGHLENPKANRMEGATSGQEGKIRILVCFLKSEI